MADLTQLEKALINADAAGDTDAARVFAAEISKLRQPKQEAKITDAFLSGVTGRFVPGLLSLPGQTIENVLNLSRAAAGTVAGAAGFPDAMPPLVSVPGNFESARKIMAALGLQTNNPLPNDPAFKAAEIAGAIAPAALIPGASVGQTAASTVGAIVGNQVAGPEGEMVGAMLPSAASAAYAAKRGDVLQARQKAAETRDATIAAARTEGYRFPPAETNPTITNKVLEGWAGKLATRQMASGQNAEVTTNIAKRSIGLGPNDVLDESSLTRVREQAGQAYDAIKKWHRPFPVDAKLRSDINSLDSAVARAAQEYPDLIRNPGIDQLKATLAAKTSHKPEAVIELIKDLRFQAKQNYKGSFAAQKPAEQVALADAQRKSADMLEGFVERSLSRAGRSQLMDDFKEARTTIARVHDIESAFNEASGTVNARVFASLSDKGRPLGGGLETVARTYKAFPHDLKTPESIGSQPMVSPLDVGAGSIVAGGNAPGLVGLMLGRPLVRSAIMSRPYQSVAGDPSYTPALQPDSALAALLRGHLAGNMTQ